MIPAAIALEDRVSERDRPCSDVRRACLVARLLAGDIGLLVEDQSARRFPDQIGSEFESLVGAQPRMAADDADCQIVAQLNRQLVVKHTE